MFEESVKTFVQVVKCGSFSKAAESMYLSPNAIKKRIKILEDKTGVTLLFRSNKGVTLTKAGESLYQDLLSINTQYQKAVDKAQIIHNRSGEALCLGMMNTFSETFTTNRWYEARRKLRQNPVQLVYYGDTLDDMDEMFQDVGKKADMCIDIYDSDTAEKYGLKAQRISEFPLYVGIPDEDAESYGEEISLSELEGQTIALLKYGRTRIFDLIHDRIRKEYPAISVKEIDGYSIRTFSDCRDAKNCILLTENQIGLYPFFTFLPMKSQISVPFGVYYKNEHSKVIEHFIAQIIPPIESETAPTKQAGL